MKVKNISSKKIILDNIIIYPNQIVHIYKDCTQLIKDGKLKVIKPQQYIKNIIKENTVAKSEYINKNIISNSLNTEQIQTNFNTSNIENLLKEIIKLLKNNSIQITKQDTIINQDPIKKLNISIEPVETITPIQTTGDDDMDSFLTNLLENSSR